jgi:3-oxoadipate enol-lactonase
MTEGYVVLPGGRRLWVAREGVPGGQPVVLLHGLSDDHGLWRYTVPALADRYATFAVDLPGHGRSDPPPDDATIAWFGDRIVALIDALGLDRPVLGGLSMGGGTAQYAALAMPGRLRGLVLVSTSPAFPEANRERFLDRAVVAERDGMAAVVDTTVPRWFVPAWMEAHPDEVAATRATVLATDPRSFAIASRANAVRDCTDRLGEIDCPVLFVGGLDDPADPMRSVPVYRERLRDVRIELFDHASHLVPVEAADRFVPVLRAFLDGLPG